MNLITLTQSGTIIDLDSVAFVRPTQSEGSNPTPQYPRPHGIKIGLAGHEQSLFGDDAHQFLADLHGFKKANVEKLMKWIPESEELRESIRD
jgi:hypothetical protein